MKFCFVPLGFTIPLEYSLFARSSLDSSQHRAVQLYWAWPHGTHSIDTHGFYLYRYMYMFVYGALHLVLPPYSGACETNTNVRRDPCGYPPLPNLIQQAKAGVLLLLLSCIWMPIHLRRAGMTWHCFARCSFGATYPTIAGGTVEKSCLVACRRQHRTHAILLSLRMFQENSNEGRGSAFFRFTT